MARRGPGEGSVYRRRDGRWVAQVRDPAGNPVYEYYRTQAEAQAAKQRLLNERDAGMLRLAPDRLVVGDFLAYWLETSVKPPHRQYHTYRNYEQVFRNHINPVLGEIPLARLSTHQVDAFLTNRLTVKRPGKRTGYAPQTVAVMRTVLESGLEQALKWGWVKVNVARASRRPPVEPVPRTPLDPDQAREFRRFLVGHPHEAFFALLMTLGLRFSEAAGLRWEDLDAGRRRLVVMEQQYRVVGEGFRRDHPKSTHSGRVIPIPPGLLITLQDHRTQQQAARLRAGLRWQDRDGLMFTTRTGAPLDNSGVVKQLRRLSLLAGVPIQTPHLLRHCAGSLLMDQGVHIKVIQEILGHADPKTTATLYLHTIPEHHRDAINRIDRLLGGE